MPADEFDFDSPKLAWCPPEYRDEYRSLASRSDIRPAEAKRILLDHIEVVERRKRRMATPYSQATANG